MAHALSKKRWPRPQWRTAGSRTGSWQEWRKPLRRNGCHLHWTSLVEEQEGAEEAHSENNLTNHLKHTKDLYEKLGNLLAPSWINEWTRKHQGKGEGERETERENTCSCPQGGWGASREEPMGRQPWMREGRKKRNDRPSASQGSLPSGGRRGRGLGSQAFLCPHSGGTAA